MDISGLSGGFALATVFSMVLLQQLGAPIPPGPFLILAGATAFNDPLHGVYALALAVAASALGSLPWFYAGRRYGNRVLAHVCRLTLSADACVRRTEGVFARYGMASLVAAKFVPGFARMAPPLAGALRVGLARFLAYSGTGAALWAGTVITLGLVFHRQIDWVLERLTQFGAVGALVVATALALYVTFRFVKRRLFARARELPPNEYCAAPQTRAPAP